MTIQQLQQTIIWLQQNFRRHFNVRQLLILLEVSQEEGRPQSEVAQATGSKVSSCYKHFRRLERYGLIELRIAIGQSGTPRNVYLTDEGRHLLDGLQKVMGES